MPGLDRKFSRRAMLSATGAALLGWQARDVLALAGQRLIPTAEHIILFWNSGGMSHIDTWDPKPGRPTAGEFQAIKTSVPGIEISEIFPQLARQMHHCSLIRSLTGAHDDHVRATSEWQTGFGPTSGSNHPRLGSVVVHQRERLSELPAYVSIGRPAPGAGELGPKCKAYFVAEPGDHSADLARRFGKRSDAFNLNNVPASTLSRYGDTHFGRSCLLARQLVEGGVRCVQVHRAGFDTHSANFPALRCQGEVIDPALASLIADLAESGLLQQTLIVMLSEFGRSPKINDDAGRGHWSTVFSCCLAGGGVKGGQVIGSSDADGYQPRNLPVQAADLHTTLCEALGIDLEAEPSNLAQRPTQRVAGGSLIRDLFV